MKMKLVKHFNLAFVISLVVISNLVNGEFLNHTPPENSPPASDNNDIHREALKSPQVVGAEDINAAAFNNPKKPSETLDSELDDITDISPEMLERVLKEKGALKSPLTVGDSVNNQVCFNPIFNCNRRGNWHLEKI